MKNKPLDEWEAKGRNSPNEMLLKQLCEQQVRLKGFEEHRK